ncbi:hypothetical protein B0H19DRAFT_1061220 [Mycena capillaripes]|nr:hypothetical protein B0H19DRAFT_1061220 [Mycena capillaripes]
MSTIPEDPVSIVASQLPNNLSVKALFAIIIFAVIARLFHYSSPQRLTAVLVDAMDKLKKTSSTAFEMGRLSACEIEKLNTLRRKVCTIQAETLNNSRSNWRALCEFSMVAPSRCFSASGKFSTSRRTSRSQIQLLTPQPSPGAADSLDNAQTVVNGGTLTRRGGRRVDDA